VEHNEISIVKKEESRRKRKERENGRGKETEELKRKVGGKVAES